MKWTRVNENLHADTSCLCAVDKSVVLSQYKHVKLGLNENSRYEHIRTCRSHFGHQTVRLNRLSELADELTRSFCFNFLAVHRIFFDAPVLKNTTSIDIEVPRYLLHLIANALRMPWCVLFVSKQTKHADRQSSILQVVLIATFI